jgi:hypothetical protein
MKMSTLYRVLLHLYPASFRKQFSEEMICVFEQSAGERLANRKSASVAFLFTEFFGIVRGATIMWLAKILPAHRAPSSSTEINANDERLSIAQVAAQRDAVIRNMVAAIARHDFSNARHYSYEEVRLKRLLQDRERTTSVGKMTV